jgi:hypothetical protein
MRKNSIICMWLCAVLVLSVGAGLLEASTKFEKPRLYIKVKGMGSMTSGGDFGDFVDRNEVYYTELDGNAQYDADVTVPSFFRGYAAEIGFDMKRFAVGISVGYLEKNFQTDYTYYGPDGYEQHYNREQKLSAVPIFLLIHYKLLDTRLLTASLTVGEGVYLSKYRDDREQSFKNSTVTNSTSYVECKKNKLGFHAGITLDFNITHNFALSMEAAYRAVKFDELEAEDYYISNVVITPNETEGDLYYWTNRRTGAGLFGIGESTLLNWDSEEAEFNLNGFSFTVGIKFTFGSRRKPEPPKYAPMDN